MPTLNSSFAPSLIDSDGQMVADTRTLLADEGAVDAQSHILPYARALNELPHSNASFAVRIEPTDDVRALKPYLAQISLIEINFPAFRDGRGYSTARIARDDLGFAGPIRAVGDVLRDQVFVMLRAGFSEFALKDSDPVAAMAGAKSRFSSVYQTASDTSQSAWQRRQKARS